MSSSALSLLEGRLSMSTNIIPPSGWKSSCLKGTMQWGEGAENVDSFSPSLLKYHSLVPPVSVSTHWGPNNILCLICNIEMRTHDLPALKKIPHPGQCNSDLSFWVEFATFSSSSFFEAIDYVLAIFKSNRLMSIISLLMSYFCVFFF